MKKLLLLTFLLAFAATLPAGGYKFNTASQWELRHKNKAVQKGDHLLLSGGVEAFTVKEFDTKGKKGGLLTAEIRTDATVRLPGITLAVVFYNEYGKMIHTKHYRTIAGSFTELAAPVKLMDKTIRGKATPAWKRAKSMLVAFDAKEDETDLPTQKLSIPVVSCVVKNGVATVTFAGPLFAELPAGSKVRLHHSAGYFMPCPENAWYNRANKEWKKIGGKFKIPAGAISFRPAIIFRGAKMKDVSFEIRNIDLKID